MLSEKFVYNYFNLLLTNVILDNDVRLNPDIVSLIHCGTSCIGHNDCRSFFHSSLNKACFPSNSLWNESTLKRSSGQRTNIRYFINGDEHLDFQSNVSLQPAVLGCDRDGFRYSPLIGLCYRHFSRQRSWNGSISVCRRQKADLFTVDRPAIHTFFQTVVDKETNGQYTWIAGHRSHANFTWSWPNGRTINETTTYWHEGEPNYSPLCSVLDCQRCMAYERRSQAGFKWDNGMCTKMNGVYCQYKP